VIREARTEQRGAARDRDELAQNDLRSLLALRPERPASVESAEDRAPVYCRWLDRVQGIISPKTAEAETPAQPPPEEPADEPPVQTPVVQTPAVQAPAVPIPAVQAPAVQRPRPQSPPARAKQAPGPAGLPKALHRPAPPAARPQLSNWAQVATATDRATDADRRADRFAVEVHKKWAISLACASFVIVGLVMALRFPRGGIGLVIGGGLLVFSVHYVGLTAGESLADRGLMSPWLAMWLPNIVLTIIGLIGLFRVSRESGSTRGGDFQEVLDGLRHLARRLRRWRAPAGEAR
jgi:lipopolysaccharide export system permease protein